MLKKIIGLAICTVALQGPAFAQDLDQAVADRQAIMKTYGKNLGILGKMASGSVDYDAAAAQAAAQAFMDAATSDQTLVWLEGSEQGAVDGSRAKISIWEQSDDFYAIVASLADASVALNDVAAQGADALGGAIGPAGQTCKTCHSDYRGPKN